MRLHIALAAVAMVIAGIAAGQPLGTHVVLVNNDLGLLVFDARGRVVRLLRAGNHGGAEAVVDWDGRDAGGRPVASGTYFLKWDDGVAQAAGKLTVVR